MHRLDGERHVIDVRDIGLVGAVELAPREGAPGARAFDLFLDCLERGVLVRVAGDTIALSPPLIVSTEQIDEIVHAMAAGLRRLA